MEQGIDLKLLHYQDMAHDVPSCRNQKPEDVA